jgi:hypothetical protein
MNANSKAILQTASQILAIEAKFYYNEYRRTLDSESKKVKDAGFRSFEKFNELNRLARELDIISEDKL